MLRAREQLGATYSLPGQKQGQAGSGNLQVLLCLVVAFFFSHHSENKNAIVSCSAAFGISSPLTIF